MSEKTILEPDVEETKPAPAKKKPAKKKKSLAAFTPAEVESKLDIVCSLAARITGREYGLKPADFKQEAAALVRISEKLELVAQGLTLFDPIVIIAGITAKFMGMVRKEKTKPAAQPQPAAAGNVTPIKEIAING